MSATPATASTASRSPWIVDRRPAATLVRGVGARLPIGPWETALERAAARHGPQVVVVGKRVSPEGTLLAMGELVVHPKGLHSIGRGAPSSAHRFPLEVDGSLDGVALFPRSVADDLPPPVGPLGLLTHCLEARTRGCRIVAVPEVVTGHVDAPIGLTDADLARFQSRFGFWPTAPDIDAIAARPDLASLRWNMRYFGAALPFEKYRERGAFHWEAYASHEAFRTRADWLVALAREVARPDLGPTLDIGCGDGLFAARLAAAGVPVLGIDDDVTAIRLATDRAPEARFAGGSAYALPVADGSAGGALLLDVIEHLHNPARAIRELARVLAPAARLVLSTPEWQYGASSDPTYHVDEFSEGELARLVTARSCFEVERTARIGGVYRDLVLVARRT